jgi:hypothetical protein
VTNAWSDALDALEARIDRQRAFIDGRGPLPEGSWGAPDEPLPTSLRGRAVLLASSCDEIESRLTRMMAERHEPLVSPYR